MVIDSVRWFGGGSWRRPPTRLIDTESHRAVRGPASASPSQQNREKMSHHRAMTLKLIAIGSVDRTTHDLDDEVERLVIAGRPRRPPDREARQPPALASRSFPLPSAGFGGRGGAPWPSGPSRRTPPPRTRSVDPSMVGARTPSRCPRPWRRTADAYDRRVVLRCTRKLLDVIRAEQLAAPQPDGEDWYANLLVLDRRKCLLEPPRAIWLRHQPLSLRLWAFNSVSEGRLIPRVHAPCSAARSTCWLPDRSGL